jgi:hypothetical protein
VHGSEFCNCCHRDYVLFLSLVTWLDEHTVLLHTYVHVHPPSLSHVSMRLGAGRARNGRLDFATRGDFG